MLNSLARRPRLAAVAVFLLAASVAAALIWRMDQYERQEIRVRTLNLAGEHAYSLQRGIAHNLSSAYALAALVRQGRGAVPNFDEVAREMLPYYPGVSELALAPGGVIRRVAPLAGNEKAIGHDLLRDPAQKKEALLARDSGKLTLAGPLELVQGGPAVVGRLPVILEDQQGTPYFWGFAMTVMRFPQALEAVNSSRLTEQGFDYELWRTHPDGGRKQIIAASSNSALVDAVVHSLQVPNATWTLSLAPIAGWGNPVSLALGAALGLLFSLLLAYLAKLLLELRLHRAGLEALVAQRSAELRKSELHYREMFEASPQPMWVYDLETLKFLAVNDAAVARYGYSRGEFEAMCILDIRPQEEVPRLLQRIAEARKGDNGASGIWRHRRKDGALIDVEISSSIFAFSARRAQLVLANDITDRLRAERKLSESEARFRSLTEMSSDFYWESDAEHRLMQLTTGNKEDPALILPGGSPLGKPRWDVPYLTPDAAGWEAHRIRLDAHLPFRDFEYSRMAVDGVARHIAISGDPVFDASGAFQGYRGVGKDISERKAAAAKIARLSQLYAALGQCNQAIVRCASEEELFPRICRDAVQFGGMKSARISLVDPGTRRVRVAASFGYGNEEVQDIEVSTDADSPYGSGPTGTAIRENRPYWGQDFMNDPATLPWRARGAHLGWGAVAALPLHRNGAVVGAFIVFDGEANAFDQARRELLLEMAGDISFAMDNFEREARRRQAEHALRESEARFRSLTEMSSDFYWETDAEHRLTQRSSGSGRNALLALTHDDWSGRHRWEIPYLAPDESGWQAHRAVLDAHLPVRDFEFVRAGVDGGARHILIHGDPVFDASGAFRGYRGVGTDITERKHEERLLRLEHAVARSLAEASDESSALITVIRSVCETNNWGRGTYWRLDEAAGVMRFGEHWSMPGAEFERYTEGSRAVVFAPGAGIVGRVWQSGEPLWIADFYNDPRVVQKALAREAGMRSVLVFPVMAAGSTFGVFAFFSSVAREPDLRLLAATRMIGSAVGQFLQRMQAEAQVSRINAELEARVASRTRELEIAVSELEAFSYSVSHDLRAPLRAIHGFSSLLREQYARQIDEQGRDMLRRVSAGTEKMGQLIDDLLKLSRVSRQEMKVEPVDLSEMAWEVIGELQAEAPERRVEWVIAPQASARGDAGLLRVVLQNLIGNAWKYSAKREHARVEFGVAERDGRPAYFVRDNGAGFDMAQAKKLFGAFQRLHSTAEFPGSGIGLATVSRVIHRHGGEVWGEGRVGEGARFWFSLARSGGSAAASAKAGAGEHASDDR